MNNQSKTTDELIQEIQRLKKEVERAEKKFEKVFQSANDAVLILEGMGIVDCNKKSTRIFKRNKAELINRNIFDFSPKVQPDGVESVQKSQIFMESALRGERQIFDWQFVRSESDVFYARTVLDEMTIGGKIFLIAQIKDLSRKKVALKTLKEGESKFKTLADNAPVLLRMTTPNNYFYYFSKQWLDFTGKTEKEQQNNGWIEGIYSKEVDTILSQIDLAFKRRQKYQVIYRLKRFDGAYRWVQDTGIPHFDEDGKFAGYISATVDISDRKRLEETESRKLALAESEKRLHSSLKKANILAVTVDNKGDITFCNEALNKLIGISKSKIVNKNLFDMVVVPAEKSQGEKPDFGNFIESGGFSNNLETFVKTASGELVEVRFNSMILNNEKGQISGMTIIGEDISEKVKVKKALDKTNAQLKELFDNSNDLIQVFNHAGDFLLVNLAWKEKLGYSDEEIRQIKFMDVIHPIYKSATLENLRLIATGEDIEKIETVFLSKDRRSIFLSGSVNCSIIGEEEIEYRGIFHDITERVRAEKAQNLYYSIANLTSQSQDLNELFKNIHGELAKVIPANNFYISLYQSGDAKVNFPYFVDEYYPGDPGSIRRPVGKRITEYAIKYNRPLFLHKTDIKALIREKVITHEGKIPNIWLGVPLRLENKSIGLIAIQSYDERVKYDFKDLDLLDFISGQVAIAIDRKQAELALLRSEKKFRHIFESFQDIYFRCKVNGEITIVSPSINELVGYSEEEVLGMNITDYYLYNTKTKDLVRQLVKRKSVRNFEASVITKKGNILQCICNVRLVYNEQNQPVEIEGVARDITKLKKANLDLLHAKEIAERSLKVKETFLANMSHEIRTPMNGIIGMIDLLASTELANEQKEYVQIIKKSSETLLSILNSILDLSKIEAGKMKLKISTIFLIDTLEKLYALFSQQALAKNINLFYHIDERIPTYLKVDEIRLLQVFSNLISNAIKFTKGGGAINIDLKLSANEKKSVLIKAEIRDSGIGISKENIDKLFNNFSQLDNSSTKSYGGTGLGLAISKELTQLMGGEIGVYSTPGFGSTFWFTFRAEKSTKTAFQQDSKKKVDPVLHREFEKVTPRILVVDDNQINRQVASQILRKAGCKVDTANSGPDAIDLIKRKSYEVVFMDIQMPEMDGISATREIKKLAMKDHPPIVAMTAYSMKEDRERFLKEGLDDYIPKPLKAHNLIDKVKEMVLKDGYKKSRVSSEKECEETTSLKVNENTIIDEEVMSQLIKYGGKETLDKVYEDFEKEASQQFEDLMKALKNKNYTEILSILHTIKGNAGTLGIAKMHESASKIESNFKTQQYVNAKEQIAVLMEQFATYRLNYKNILNNINHVRNKESTSSRR